ncbi:MAG: hypothetical protein IKK10_00540 [Clostridia bacterium]|nr:hypothetical protein [Clostridia bacterium]
MNIALLTLGADMFRNGIFIYNRLIKLIPACNSTDNQCSYIPDSNC